MTDCRCSGALLASYHDATWQHSLHVCAIGIVPIDVVPIAVVPSAVVPSAAVPIAVVPIAVEPIAVVPIAVVPMAVVSLHLCHCSCAIAIVPLQEARKTVTAGAVFRPFPGDDWQASGELIFAQPHSISGIGPCGMLRGGEEGQNHVLHMQTACAAFPASEVCSCSAASWQPKCCAMPWLELT